MKKMLFVIPMIVCLGTAAIANEDASHSAPAAQTQGVSAADRGHGGHEAQGSIVIDPFGMSTLGVVGVPPAVFFVRMQEELKLSEDQHEQGHVMWGAYMDKVKPAADAASETAKALREAMNAVPTDAVKIKAAMANSLKAEETLANVCVDFWIEFRTSLTPDQNQKLSEHFKGPRKMIIPKYKTSSTQTDKSTTSATSTSSADSTSTVK